MSDEKINRLMTENKELLNQSELLKQVREMRADVLANSMSQLITSNQSFMQSNLTSFLPMLVNNIYAPLTLNWTLLMYFYKTHGPIQTAIDEPVLDAFRGGLELHSKQLGVDELKDLEDDLERTGVFTTLVDTFIWTRLFGGGALVINTESDPGEPLRPKDFKGRVEFYDACRWELGAPKRIWSKYLFYNQTLDASRVLTVTGKRAPFVIRWQLAGWGMSEVERMVEAFNLYIRTNNVLYEILDEAKLDVYKLEGLNANLISSQGTGNVQRRINLMNQLKNFQNALVIDMKDDYLQKQLTFSGLAEIMKETRIGLAAALRMPMTKLFGLSASGFNSGEDDIENYNAMVESEVREPARPIIRKLLEFKMLQMFGKVYDLKFKFKPLRVLGANEEEDVKSKKHQRIIDLYDRQVIDSQELAEAEEKDGLISIETQAAKGLVEPHPQSDDEPAGEGDKEDGSAEK